MEYWFEEPQTKKHLINIKFIAPSVFLFLAFNACRVCHWCRRFYFSVDCVCVCVYCVYTQCTQHKHRTHCWFISSFCVSEKAFPIIFVASKIRQSPHKYLHFKHIFARDFSPWWINNNNNDHWMEWEYKANNNNKIRWHQIYDILYVCCLQFILFIFCWSFFPRFRFTMKLIGCKRMQPQHLFACIGWHMHQNWKM